MLTLAGKFVVAIVTGVADLSFSGTFVSRGELKLGVTRPFDALVYRLT